jgi:hypothetical protein
LNVLLIATLNLLALDRSQAGQELASAFARAEVDARRVSFHADRAIADRDPLLDEQDEDDRADDEPEQEQRTVAQRDPNGSEAFTHTHHPTNGRGRV